MILRSTGKFLSSLRLTVTLLALSMVLIFVGTISQVSLGIHEVVDLFFRSWIAWWDVMPGERKFVIPLPGGSLLGCLLIVNLLAAHGARFKLSRGKAGMMLIHSGILLMLVGELFTGFLGKEAQMTVNEGQTMNYSTFPREVELAVIEASGDGMETVHAIPQSRLKDGAEFPFPGFTLRIDRHFGNSEILEEKIVGDGFDPIRATAGAGIGYAVRDKPSETAMDRRDLTTAFVSVVPDGGGPSGRWLLSNALVGGQSFEADGKIWKFAIRQARLYHPFSIKLLDFSHDRYLGTNVPKNFSSKIRLLNPSTGEDREDLIYMNHPLRYQGLTFYQSGFANDDTTTIFQVVKNPVWTLPYISCAMVSAGLLWVFSSHLLKAVARRKNATAAKIPQTA
jgi:hypothetical protein